MLSNGGLNNNTYYYFRPFLVQSMKNGAFCGMTFAFVSHRLHLPQRVLGHLLTDAPTPFPPPEILAKPVMNGVRVFGDHPAAAPVQGTEIFAGPDTPVVFRD